MAHRPLTNHHPPHRDSNKRWFKVQAIQGSDELALCWFKSKTAQKEPRGWLFLRDVIEIREKEPGAKPAMVLACVCARACV